MKPSPLSGFLLSCTLAVAAGCGDDLGLTSVSGTVTLDGKPVPGALVTFAPQAAQGSPSSDVTDGEGKYTLRFSRDREGVLPGTHDVTVTTEKVSAEDVTAAAEAGEEVPEFVPVPQKYTRKGELVREVEPAGGEVNLELTGK